VARSLILPLLAAAIATLAPAAASAAPCTTGSTNWTGGAANNDFGTEANWSNGVPTATCDTTITAATAPVILSGAGNVEDLTVGPGQTLKLQDSVFPTLHAVSIQIQNNGTIQLGCVIGATCGVAADPAAQMIASSTEPDAIANAGTILIAGAGNDAERQIWGNVTNTGTLQVNNGMRWTANGPDSDTFMNRGTVSLSPGCKPGGGGDCMYASSSDSNFVNDVGGNVTNNGGTKFLLTEGGYTQGAGSTSTGAQSPVVMRGGTLSMTGATSTAVVVTQGNNPTSVSGTVGPGQTIKVETTLAVVSGPLINQGTIRTTNSALLNGNITTTGSGLLDITATTSSNGVLDATGGNILVGAQLNLSQPLMNHGGQITGLGPIIGSVNNVSGIVNPRNGIGSMTITGNYTQGAAGTLAIEAQGAAGPQHDLLLVGGNPTLDGILRIVPETGYFTPAEGDALKVLDYSGTRTGTFSSSVADPAFTSGNAVNAGYDNADTSVFAFIGPPTVKPSNGGGTASLPSLLGSPFYKTILESLEPNGSFTFTKKPVVFPDGKLGLEVDTGGSCRLTAVEKTVGSAGASASASKKAKKKPKGLVKKVTIYANGSGTHVIPLNLTAKGKKLLTKKGKKGKKGMASASAAKVLKDPLVITCTPIVYPVANFTDGTQVTGIGQAPTGKPPAGQPSIPSGPPTVVKTGGPTVTQKPVVPLPVLPPDPPAPPTKLYKATVDNDATVGANVRFFSNGKVVTGFDASFRIVCNFPFPNSAPLETVHFDSIPAVSVLNGGSGVIQGSFALAQQEGSSLPPTWITVGVNGDSSNGYSVRVYERRAGCEGGTTFNARRS
jgi:hypothetical protein